MTAERSVLVTGATGFVGRAIAQELALAGWRVVGTTHRADTHADPDVHLVGADLLDPGGRDDAVARADASVLVHAAWGMQPGYLDSGTNVDWLYASVQLFRAFCASGGQRIVGVGSGLEYIAEETDTCHPDRTPRGPGHLYGNTKEALRLAGDALARSHDLDFCWVRLFHLFGPGEFGGRFVPSLTSNLLQGNEAPMSSGSQVRDFLDVRDAAFGVRRVVEAEVTGQINVASGCGRTLGELADELADLTGRPDLLRKGALPDRATEARRIVADVSELEALGFEPRESMRARLAEAVERTRATLGQVS